MKEEKLAQWPGGLGCTDWADLLVALFLPLRDQHGIRIAVLQEPLVKLPADSLFLVVKIIDIPTPPVRYLEDRPLRLVFGNVIGRGV